MGLSLFSLLYLSFRTEMPILCLSHHCVLEARILFSFTNSQLEQNLSQDESYFA